MAPWLPSGRIRAHEHERGGFSAGASGHINQRWVKGAVNVNKHVASNYKVKTFKYKSL